jgi:drug/metabolite transporter (DMT)-like permease
MLALRDEADASGTVALISSYPLVSLLILTALFAQPAAWTLWIGTGVVCAGVSLVQQTSPSAASRRMLIYSAMSSLSWGVWAVADWNALRYGTPLQLVALSSALALVSALPLAVGMRIFRQPITLSRESRLPSLASGLLYAASEFTFYFALDGGRAAGYVIALTAAYPLITLLGACVRGTESFTAKRMAAITVLAAGVGILQG